MKKIVLLFLGILTFSYLFSQEKKLEFVDYKDKGDGYTVYYNVANLESEEQAQLILKDLLDCKIIDEEGSPIKNIKHTCQGFLKI
mgnify:CR=1 FL=1